MTRTHYPSKAAWAAAQAAQRRAAADALPRVPGSDWRGVRRRQAARLALQAEAARFDAIARRLGQATPAPDPPF
jgi:hypothetical protein